MTFGPANAFGYFLDENMEFSKDNNDLNWQLKEFITQNAISTNIRDIGVYNIVETVIGQKFFSSDVQKFKDIFRIVIDMGQLPNAALKQIAHGLSNVDNNWFFTRIYGTATEPAGAAPRPIFIPI